MGWIGVDLDGTLAMHDGWQAWDHIGDPVPLMVKRVKKWLEEGQEVRIVTARVAPPYPDCTKGQITQAIQDWCFAYLGRVLPITCCKDFGMIVLWDDRCVRVEANTGVVVGPAYSSSTGYGTGYRGYRNSGPGTGEMG